MLPYGHVSETAIQATVYLATRSRGRLTPVREIAREMGLRAPYLAKVVPLLIRGGLLRAVRGPGGGVELIRSPEEIPLWSVVRAVEGPAPPERCALGLKACSGAQPCPLHPKWAGLRERMRRLLEETTLAAVAEALTTTRPGPRRRRAGGEHAVSD